MSDRPVVAAVTERGDASPPPRAGYRLNRVELLNWGTFDGKVWTFDVGGGSALLTGQVGAGKSTLVDGLSILLNPPSQVSFNRAAGAERRERTLRSYVLGAHRNVADEVTGGSRPEYLRRPADALSIVLVAFVGPAGRPVTAAVVLRFQNETTTPNWLYLLADADLSIAEHLSGHRDVRAMRSALRTGGAALFDQFNAYQKQLCRKLRLTPAALSLFNQTVSMKSVGNLTDFVRAHMLDAPDVAGAIKRMLAHYADLTRAHDLVVDARRQLTALDKVVEASKAVDDADTKIVIAEGATTAVAARVDALRAALLEAAIKAALAALPELTALKDAIEREQDIRTEQRTELEVRIRSAGGSDLSMAERDLSDAIRRVEQVVLSNQELARVAAKAGVQPPTGLADFRRFREDVRACKACLGVEAAALRDRQVDGVNDLTNATGELKALDEELTAARTRPSNIPINESALRDRIADAAGVSSEELPYVGELLAVAAGEEAWEAAAERLVRPFALSLLVPERLYRTVADWVDANHLGHRLVYQRVPATIARAERSAGESTIASKLTVRPDTTFTAWLSVEVNRRYDHVCVENAAALAERSRAVTRAGQVKDGNRHEKDDRQRADDRRHFVLGWDTRARRKTLEAARAGLAAAVKSAGEQLERIQRQAAELRERDLAGVALERYVDPAQLDVAGAMAERDKAQQHRDELAADPTLVELTDRRDQLDKEIRRLKGRYEEAVGRLANTRESLSDHKQTFAALIVPVMDLDSDTTKLLDRACSEAGAQPTHLSGCDGWGRRVRERVDSFASGARSQRARAATTLVGVMKDYSNSWPAVTVDINTADESARTELAEIRARLITDDLPRFERDFKDQLERNAIHEIAVFSRGLDKDARAIADRVATINAALAEIDYQHGTFIALAVEPTKDQFVREFRVQLRAITEDAVTEDATYSEVRFLKVRELLDRFAGREGSSEEDQRWTKRVTDVRNWHTFAATERSRDENTLVEHYTDSDGKSGGQKEKLAYTILAASLSYQYGLAGGEDDSFRFVMIDEAFGRGSDESTRYGLELFTRLGLQLLVVTPLQKIRTIESYVDAVGYVSSDGKYSRLLSMTISDFRARRAEHHAPGPAVGEDRIAVAPLRSAR